MGFAQALLRLAEEFLRLVEELLRIVELFLRLVEELLRIAEEFLRIVEELLPAQEEFPKTVRTRQNVFAGRNRRPPLLSRAPRRQSTPALASAAYLVQGVRGSVTGPVSGAYTVYFGSADEQAGASEAA